MKLITFFTSKKCIPTFLTTKSASLFCGKPSEFFSAKLALGSNKFSFFSWIKMRMLSSSYNFKVFNSVVSFNSIFMMNCLISIKNSIDMLFHNKSMLKNISMYICVRMIFAQFQDISRSMTSYSTNPSMMICSRSPFNIILVRSIRLKCAIFRTIHSAIFSIVFNFKLFLTSFADYFISWQFSHTSNYTLQFPIKQL